MFPAGQRVRFNRSGLGIVSTFLGNNEVGTFHFQDSGGVDSGSRFRRSRPATALTAAPDFRDADLVSRVDGLVTGDLLDSGLHHFPLRITRLTPGRLFQRSLCLSRRSPTLRVSRPIMRSTQAA